MLNILQLFYSYKVYQLLFVEYKFVVVSVNMNEITRRNIIEAYIKRGQSAPDILKHMDNPGISRATVYRQVQKLRNGTLRDLGHAGARSVS